MQFPYFTVLFFLTGITLHFVLPPTVERVSASEDPSEIMRAAFYTTHGPPSVLQVGSVARPLPKYDQLLVKVEASALNPCDFKFRRAVMPSLLANFIWPKPKVPGADISGIVVSAPQGSVFRAGDRVAAMLPLLGSKWGAHAEYVAVREEFVGLLPSDLTHTQAASLPLVGLTTKQAFDHVEGGLEGKKVFIQAGGGGVGTFAIQYAKQLGASYIATTSSSNASRIKSLGADLVIDYTKQDFSEMLRDFDVVFDTMSYVHEAKTLSSGILKKGGHYLNIFSSDWATGSYGEEKGNGLLSFFNYAKYGLFGLFFADAPRYDIVMVHPNGEQLQEVLEMAGESRIAPVVDRVFPLDEISLAYAYLEKGHAKGKVCIEYGKCDAADKTNAL